jgi:2-oxo-4-hydroxy-4-carboxy-5-ureidoimidazoline decarboxylase
MEPNQTRTRIDRILQHLQMSTTTSSSSPEMSSSLITSFNAVPEPQLTTDLLHLCASSSWAKMVTQQRPYQNIPDLVQRATRAWYTLGHTAWQEAYAGHGSLGVKTAEQTQAVAAATTTTLASLQQANQVYEAKHGHKCITFAAGKDSKRLLHEVTSRTPLSVEEEMRRCAEQTMLITALRLVRYVHEGGSQSHVLFNPMLLVCSWHHRRIEMLTLFLMLP